MLERRRLLTSVAAFVATPAIVRASSLMAISPVTIKKTWHLCVDTAGAGLSATVIITFYADGTPVDFEWLPIGRLQAA